MNITIPQGTTLDFEIIHTDDQGNPVDHTSSTIAAAIQSSKAHIDISDCFTGTATGFRGDITAEISDALDPKLEYGWDLIATTTGGSVTRICYGSVKAVDTYALDEA